MDRDDAAFVANVLERRIEGAREDLERLAASSLMRVTMAAARIRAIAGDWPPAIAAAGELMAIGRLGGAVCDKPLVGDIQPFIDSMKKVAAEPVLARNRAARRAAASKAARVSKLIGFSKPDLGGRNG